MDNSNLISWLVIAMFFVAMVMGQRWTNDARKQLDDALQTSIKLEEVRHAATLRHQATIIKGMEELKAMLKSHNDWQARAVEE
jgi:tripartite-type tricarboxylate transporter receptor subunit TctC